MEIIMHHISNRSLWHAAANNNQFLRGVAMDTATLYVCGLGDVQSSATIEAYDKL